MKNFGKKNNKWKMRYNTYIILFYIRLTLKPLCFMYYEFGSKSDMDYPKAQLLFELKIWYMSQIRSTNDSKLVKKWNLDNIWYQIWELL